MMRRRTKNRDGVIRVNSLCVLVIWHSFEPDESARRGEHHSGRNERGIRDTDGEGEVVDCGCGRDEVEGELEGFGGEVWEVAEGEGFEGGGEVAGWVLWR